MEVIQLDFKCFIGQIGFDSLWKKICTSQQNHKDLEIFQGTKMVQKLKGVTDDRKSSIDLLVHIFPEEGTNFSKQCLSNFL